MGQGAFTIQTHARGALPPTLTARAKGSASPDAPLQPHANSSSLRAALMDRGGGARNRTRRFSEQFARQVSSLLRVSSSELPQAASSLRLCNRRGRIRTSPEGCCEHLHDQSLTSLVLQFRGSSLPAIHFRRVHS